MHANAVMNRKLFSRRYLDYESKHCWLKHYFANLTLFSDIVLFVLGARHGAGLGRGCQGGGARAGLPAAACHSPAPEYDGGSEQLCRMAFIP